MTEPESEKPLSGSHILLTRPAGQNEVLKKLLTGEGADVSTFPAIEILPLEDFKQLDEQIHLARAQQPWVCFFSTNGVKYFFERAEKLGFSATNWKEIRLAAVGKSTKTALEKLGLNVAFMPKSANSVDFAQQFAAEKEGENKPILLIGADRGGAGGFEILKNKGFEAKLVPAYQNRDTEKVPSEIGSAFAESIYDWVVITSSASAANLSRLFGQQLKSSNIATISPITAAKLQQLGLAPAAVASDTSDQGICQAILESTQ